MRMLGLIRQALIVISGKLGQAKFDSLFRLVYLLFLRATQGLKLVSRSSKKIPLDYRHIHTLNHSQELLFPTESSPHLAKSS